MVMEDLVVALLTVYTIHVATVTAFGPTEQFECAAQPELDWLTEVGLEIMCCLPAEGGVLAPAQRANESIVPRYR